MISRIDIEDMTDAQDEAPECIWAQPEHSDEPDYGGFWAKARVAPAVEYIRADLARAKIDHLSETCGYAISQWEDWVRDQFEGTSKFAGAMAEVEATRAAVRDSQFADLARPTQAGDERVARLIEAAHVAIDTYDRPATGSGNLFGAMRSLSAALAAMDTPKGGGDE